LKQPKIPQTHGANTELKQAHPVSSDVMLFAFEGMTVTVDSIPEQKWSHIILLL